ncbi:MAG TPA: hypothetical protein VN025_18680 [Candidatus Dormibacteraeota bacterium]|jgi:hypothetical protein|nr:hypothetical protein [Candidatus Dormibacteraeota bacterium]
MNTTWKFTLLFSAGALFGVGSQAQQPADTSSQTNAQTSANSPATKENTDTADKKTKRVWTDDDLHKLGGVSVVGDGKSGARTRYTSGNSSKDAAAANYKQQLVKLQGQLDDTNRKITELQNFNGDNSTDTAIQTNHRLNRASVADQITQLESKKKQIEAQIQNIFDQARHSGIEPGALR